MKTVLWDRVKGTVSALPVPFIGRESPGGRPSLEEDEVEQALRQASFSCLLMPPKLVHQVTGVWQMVHGQGGRS
ncbi:g3827 [Coccomyxa viridis]|uniref:G3827 protein n=1 Tax=Coccomyxa viridis TaxID=1274662 RepID=A0ABP1FVW9_9CHLO